MTERRVSLRARLDLLAAVLLVGCGAAGSAPARPWSWTDGSAGGRGTGGPPSDGPSGPADAGAGDLPGDATGAANPWVCPVPSRELPPPSALPAPTRSRPFFPAGGANAAAAQAIVDDFTEAQWRNLVPRQSPRDPGSVDPLGRCRPAGAVRHT